MNTLTRSFPAAALFSLLCLTSSMGQGFTEPGVTFYGEIRKAGGGHTVLLQSGHLEVIFVNQSDPSNRVTLRTELYPVGPGAVKPYSYSMKAPLAWLPEAPRMGEFLSVSSAPASFKIASIAIDGVQATLPDGSKDYYTLSSASRSGAYRLDLLLAGESADTDRDGLPDWWERLHGLDPALSDSDGDEDQDGWSNLQEFRRGSSPTESNRTPVLATAQARIPESGEAGLWLHFLDSDTPDSGIGIGFTGLAQSGFQLKFDGVPIAQGDTKQLTLTDLKSGRLTVRHLDRAQRDVMLPLSWSDGGEVFSGELMVTAAAPAADDGSDASLWLDGNDLPAGGSRISTWPDRSGNGRAAMQPVSAYQPVVSGRSADFAAGVSSHLFFQDSSLPSGDQTVLAAFRAAGSSDAPQTLLSTNRGFLHLEATARPVSYPGAPVFQMDGKAVCGFVRSGASAVTSVFRRQGGLLQNIYGMSHDGENIPLTEIEPVLPTLGARRSAVSGGPEPVDRQFGGLLHELLIFPAALPEQKLRDASNYLESKWAGAVIWNLSTELRDIALSAGAGVQRRIIRGGFGQDQLAGGAGNDTISGGAGDDTLTGGSGADRFLFGAVDTGRKTITDFDQQTDVIDLSALFWGRTGDARQFVSIRLDANYSTPVPTLDSVLIVRRPDNTTQEIVLQNTVVGATQLIRMVLEGRLAVGALSIPTAVQVALTSASVPVSETLGQSFSLNVTRSGAGAAAALDVPLGFFEEALGGRFIVDDGISEGQRAVVSFPRGVTNRTLTVRRAPDLVTSGSADVEIAILPHYKYSVAGTSARQTVTDVPLVWLEVLQTDAVATPQQKARVLIHRDGSLSQSLTVDLQFEGSAVNGVHVQQMPQTITFTSGQDTAGIEVSARAAGLAGGPRILLLRLSSRDRYLAGSPHEALLYVGSTLGETRSAGFDRWLASSTGGAIADFAALSRTAPGKLTASIQAYAFGLPSVQHPGRTHLDLKIISGRPEISAPGFRNAPDLLWSVQSSSGLNQWAEAVFTAAPDSSGLRLTGDPLPPGARAGYYRLNLAVNPGLPAGAAVTALTNAQNYGMGGNGNWVTESSTGHLVGSGGNPGDVSRIITKVSGSVLLNFEMEVRGGGGNDLLAFYIDGVKQAATSAGAVSVQQSLADSGSHVLMWEYTCGTGSAVIRNLAR